MLSIPSWILRVGSMLFRPDDNSQFLPGYFAYAAAYCAAEPVSQFLPGYFPSKNPLVLPSKTILSIPSWILRSFNEFVTDAVRQLSIPSWILRAYVSSTPLL